jgi:dipeptidyl-peptidase-4
MSELSFPRQYARTRRFTLGVPRDFSISGDGRQVLFVRSRSGTDPVGCLWRLDVESGAEKLLVDPRQLLGGGGEDLAPEERARRERARETAEGVVRFATDGAQALVVFTLSGRLFTLDTASGATNELPAVAPVLEARVDHTGTHVAYVSGGALRLVGTDGSGDRALLEPHSPSVTYGLAEFVAAEEIDRLEGYWWEPSGERLLVARVDTALVRRMFIADPAHPERPPAEVRYPFAGTPNAEVTLSIVDLDGAALDVQWDRASHEYLVAVHWSTHGLLLTVESRDQRSLRLLEVDAHSGLTSLLREDSDDHWIHLVTGVPARTADGTLVWTVDRDGTRRLLVGDAEVSGDLEVRSVLDVDGSSVLFSASSEPCEVGVFEWTPAGGVAAVTGGDEPAGGAVRTGRRAGGTTILVERSLARPGTDVAVLAGGERVATIASHEDVPVLEPRVELLRAGERQIRTAMLLPAGHEPGAARLPVLLDPYGGPGMQRVVASRAAYLTSQWFADQGFAVVVADGRGTPGRGPAWEREIAGDFAGPTLQDQVDALHAAAESNADLDLSRVGIRGWSFGGYLAALAVLRRPDVFRAAVAGAPVTDWHLYDTHYTERYLGDPGSEAGASAYEQSSLLADAASLSRPLMIIHGLADDNVVVAHSLRLSDRLTAAGRSHTFLPLAGVTHMTPQETVAENLLLLQLAFLQAALA